MFFITWNLSKWELRNDLDFYYPICENVFEVIYIYFFLILHWKDLLQRLMEVFELFLLFRRELEEISKFRDIANNKLSISNVFIKLKISILKYHFQNVDFII